MTAPILLPDTQTDRERWQKQFADLKDFIANCLVDKVDYGIIKGTQKHSLYQPGAQKLLVYSRLRAAFPEADVHATEDWQTPFLFYRVRCVLTDESGAFAGESMGSCNSKEKMYASQPVFNVANTLIKMAQKRAFVGAVVSTLGLSQEFTQDMEDMGNSDPEPTRGTQTGVPRPAPTKPVQPRQTTEATSFRERFLKAAEAMGFDWKSMSKDNRMAWMKQLTQDEIDATTGPTIEQWRVCGLALEKYHKATTERARELPYLTVACKQLYQGWEPVCKEDITAAMWDHLADHIIEVKEYDEVAK